MTASLSFTVIGLVFGCIYALTATGLVVTYTTSGIFNFAHGAIGMIGAFTYWQFSEGWGLHPLIALILVLFVAAPLFGALIERVLMRRLHGAPIDLTLVVTLGLLVMLIGLANLIWKPTVVRSLPEFFAGNQVRIAGFNVSVHQLLCIAVAIVVVVSLRLFFTRTRTGIAMRAVVDNPDLVAMAGGTPARVQQLSWAFGAMLAALAGVLLAPLYQLDINTLTLLVINGYAAAMVGRLKSLPMTIAGALILGLASTYAVGYLGQVSFLSFLGTILQKVQLVIPMILLFAVLVIMRSERLRTAAVSGPRAPTPATLQSSLVWGAILVVGTAVLAGVLSPTNLSTASKGMALAFILLSLVLLTGYGGMVSLCQMTFVGLGAYGMGKMGAGGSLLGVVAAVALAAAVGALVAQPTLKLRGLYLALATLAFANAMDNIFFTEVLGSGGSLLVERPKIPFVPRTDEAYLVTLSVLFAIAAVGVLALRRGKFGRRLSALDDSPAACATLGLNINYTKLAVFTLSAGMAGLGGVLLAGVPGQVSNMDFILINSLILLLLARVGGINTVTGAFLGAMFYAVAPVVINKTVPDLAGVLPLLVGLGAISLGRDPNGMGGQIADAAAKLRRRRSTSARPPAPTPPGARPEPALKEASLARV